MIHFTEITKRPFGVSFFMSTFHINKNDYFIILIMTKLLVLPLMFVATAGIIGSAPVEARPGGGEFISQPKRCTRKNPCSRMPELPNPRKRCTRKNPCSPMPELPFFPGEIQPMPRGGFPDFGTPMPRRR